MTDTQRKIMFHRVCGYCHAIYKLEEQGPLVLDNETSQESYDKAIKEENGNTREKKRDEITLYKQGEGTNSHLAFDNIPI